MSVKRPARSKQERNAATSCRQKSPPLSCKRGEGTCRWWYLQSWRWCYPKLASPRSGGKVNGSEDPRLPIRLAGDSAFNGAQIPGLGESEGEGRGKGNARGLGPGEGRLEAWREAFDCGWACLSRPGVSCIIRRARNPSNGRQLLTLTGQVLHASQRRSLTGQAAWGIRIADHKL